MNQANYKPIDPPPILLDAKSASRACSMSVSLWNCLSSAGRTPLPVNLNSKTLWVYEELLLWAKNHCPSRSSEKWKKIMGVENNGQI